MEGEDHLDDTKEDLVVRVRKRPSLHPLDEGVGLVGRKIDSFGGCSHGPRPGRVFLTFARKRDL